MSAVLPYEEAIACHINVPNRGWYLYSGWRKRTIVNSTRLAAINSNWTNGPPPPPGYDLYQCAVQISETKTAFIGGKVNPKMITVFDWTTQTYTVQSSNFTLDKINSGCAVLKGVNGDPIVVAIGSTTIGTESWNPKTGTIQMLNATFPGPRSNANFSFKVVVVEDGQALIYYLEKTGAPPDVWKYVYATNVWTKIGSLATNKEWFLVLPVEGVHC